MEESITLNEIFAKIIRYWKQVCVVTVIIAVLLGGFQTYRMITLLNSPENTPEAIEARYQAALEDYEVQKYNLETNLETQEEALAAKKEYTQDT